MKQKMQDKDGASGAAANPVMALLAELPDTPFWNWSFAAYSKPDMSPFCIRLQDEFGADVNLVLFVAWRGSLGITVDSKDLADMMAFCENITGNIIRPLRRLRRDLKSPFDADVPELRETMRQKISAVEIYGEKLLQNALFGRFADSGHAKNAGNAADAMSANVALYLTKLGIAADLRDRLLAEFLRLAAR